MESKAPMGEISAQSLCVGDLVSWKERFTYPMSGDTINKDCMGIVKKVYLKTVGNREVKFLEIVESSTGKLKKDISPLIVQVISKVSR